MFYPTIQITNIAQAKIAEITGGGTGIRDINLVESAIEQSKATFMGRDLYPTNVSKIASITRSLIANHAYVDGNKRVGICMMLLMLHFNNIKIMYTQSELTKLGLDIAQDRLDVHGIESWINNHAKEDVSNEQPQ
jgi:death-on-curing protein